MKKSRFARMGRQPTLTLTSLLDMFTIILIFLIVSFEAENYEFKINPDVQLPESSARRNLKQAVNLAITHKGVMMDDKMLVAFSGGKPRPQDLEGGQIPELVTLLRKEFEIRFGKDGQFIVEGEEGKEAIIVVQSDKKLDYATLYLVLRSAANAGFFKYRLAIMKS